MAFQLMGFSEVWWQQLMSGVMLLLILLVAFIGNLLIIMVSTFDQRLHNPMYFFLKHLSFLDLCYILVTLPKAIVSNVTHSSSISLWGCILQVFLVVFLACTEMALLTVMSYDRYVAICRPLHYEVIMKRGACINMVTYSWFSGGASGILHTATTFSLPLQASRLVHQFFCEIPQLLKLSCSDEYLAEVGAVAVTSSLSFICFITIVLSYIHIFSTVLKIPSPLGQSKAFSTCVPHLVVVTLFLGAAAMAYLKPAEDVPSVSDLLVSVFYTVVPPTLNPIIYSLRNKDMKAAVLKYLKIIYFGLTTC
ncbi:olfactory receptor 14J1-like [Pongo abelii]|uniref:olfactory receptor 14J1-like n=1 Tax=Pongo abelii TaxID=9601 RepID=UPI0004F41A54|nr:olfactory receptor 14J1-like [Pongo abelii]